MNRMLTFFLLLVAPLSALHAADTPTQKPNIVFFLIDDLGYADCGFNGGTQIKTSNIDKLASGGAVIESHYVQPVCSPTRAALMTGRYATRTGVYTIVRPHAKWGLPLAERTLANALQEAGYETAITGKWHLGEFERAYLPTSRGFDHQYGHYFGAIDYFTHIRDRTHDWHRDDKELKEDGYSTHLVAREACRLIAEKNKSKPLFLYVPFNGVHGPLQVPDSYLQPYAALKGPRQKLAGMLAAVDEAIGQVVASLEKAGLRDNTLIVFSSDNGGPKPGDNAPLRDFKGSIYEGGVRGAAFAHWPNHIPSGIRIKEPMHMIDWYPTLVKLAGGSLDQKLPIDGRDVWPMLTKGAASPHDAILCVQSPEHAAVRMGNWKLLMHSPATDNQAAPAKGAKARAKAKANAKGAAKSDDVSLFNLATDPAESKDLAATEPERVAMLRAKLAELLKDAVRPGQLAVSAVGQDAPDDEIKLDPVAKPDEARKKALDRPRRVLFNNDGGEPVVEMKTPTAKDFLDCRTTKLAGTHVDSIFYCTRTSGFGVFTHFTKIGQIFTCTEGRYAGNQMGALLQAGLDPLQMQVDFGHRNNIEVFWSLRMNDTHDGSKAEYGPILFRDSKLKNEHPEYLLGTIKKPLKHGAWSAVNFALPEIRDLAFRYIEEVCQNYDIDGIELDFFRHPVFFKSTSRGEPATQAELDAMTDLVKRVRAMTEEVGTKRGKPILIAMKVPDSVEYCKTIGLDLETWLKQDCFDMLIPGGYFQINDWDYSIALAHKYGVKVYPSLDESRLKDKDANALRVATTGYRGRAASAWAAGADGVYFFNFNDTLPDVFLLKEAGDLQELFKRDRDYFASPRGVGNAAGGNYPFEKFMTIETLNPSNPRELVPGKPAVARLHTGEPATGEMPANYRLRLQLMNPPEARFLRANWNGKAIEIVATMGWFESKVTADSVKEGENQLELTFTGKSPKKVQWTDLVLQVRPKQ